MKKHYSLKKSLTTLILCLAVLGSWSQTTFNYSGTIETYIVPDGVTQISIDAFGAQGGNTNGGLGAQIYGEFTVTPGQVLNILVGQQGVVNNCGGPEASGGGGGGSFIWDSANATLPFIAAGGGGGGNTNWGGSNIDGIDGQSTEIGTGGANGTILAGPVGEGGLANGTSGTGAGGAGWNSAGNNSNWSNPAIGGESLPNFLGGFGSPDFGPGGEGGFGGGGGATCGCGGGAGYSGGSGGEGSETRAGGGGAGSFNAGINTANLSGIRTGDGLIVITPLNTPILVSSILVQGQGGISVITVDNGTLQMEAAVLPINADDGSFIWAVTNGTGTAAIDSNGLLTATSNGTVTVIAIANDDSNVTGSIVITISNQSTVSVYENDFLSVFDLYPNPTAGLLTINTDEKINLVEVINIAGQTVKAFTTNNKIDISELEKGVYFIKISFKNKEVVTKTIIKN